SRIDPLPPPGSSLEIHGHSFHLERDHHLSSVPFTPLMLRLHPRTFVQLLGALLCERRIVFVAERLETLTSCVHAAVALMYPFVWQHIFIPLLPASMLSLASAPTPFIIGVRTNQLANLLEEPISHLVMVDLDRGEITLSPGSPPLADICHGVKERAASAQNNLVKAVSKTKNFLGRLGEKDRDEWGGEASAGQLQQSLADFLLAEVRAGYTRAKKA
ncbi:unnamed protein product, partial [Chrysoparadoxa australica]